MHSFAKSQADLNWENPAVVREMQSVIDFWINKGIDGFCIDVIDMISKDFGKGSNGFGPRLHEFIRSLFDRDQARSLFTVGESGVQDIDEMIRHCASERHELSTLFQFDHMECGRRDKFTPKVDTLKSLRDILIHWQVETDKHNLIHTLFYDNHDQSPMISRIANDKEYRYESATMLATMLYLLKGIPFIYQGQEIGITSSHYDSINCFRDVESINTYHELCTKMSPEEAIKKINFGSRDNARHPIPWNDSPQGGFTAGTPWIPCFSRYREINVDRDFTSEHSIFRYFQTLLRIRTAHETLLNGTFRVLSNKDDSYFIYSRSLGNETWVIICNFEKEQDIILPFSCDAPVLSNMKRAKMEGKYKPYECAVSQIIN